MASDTAAIMPNPDPEAREFWWNVYLATADLDACVDRVRAAGGEVIAEPMDLMDQGRMALVRDPVGAQVGLWQGWQHTGCQVVNEPGALVRNDLVVADPEPARHFYAAVFDFTLEGNPDLPDFDFTFLRRPDGHEVGGIFGDPRTTRPAWNTTFEVADTDAVVEAARPRGGRVLSAPADIPYGRIATLTDPFGAEFSVITRG